MDSLVLVGLLKGANRIPPEHYHLITQCKSLINWDGWEVLVSHCYREANQVADKLANLGVDINNGCMIYESPPVEVRDCLFADSVGASWPRMITS